VFLLSAQPAFAIPSPELVVGSLSSVSQVVALVSAMLGGGALIAGARASNRAIVARRIKFVALASALCLAFSLGFNVYQYVSQRADRQSRLEATLTRPAPRVEGKTLDPALKEASYQDQLADAHGISAADAERLLDATQRGDRKDVMFLDIREAAETEMGSLPGSTMIRFPDLATAHVNFTGKTAVLFCHNGNRSFETCQALAKLGVDCRFIVGGLEKWLVEGRSLTGLKARTLADLRAVPAYARQTTLLDTHEVHDLVEREGAVFVDVRYPGEFAAYHLPGAINLPMRPTPTAALHATISALPHKPIIAPCYDRRSCFFGEVLGLELSRRGADYRGRYTLPWEYFATEAPRPYIQEWLQIAHRSWWDRLVGLVAAGLRNAADHIGFLLSIALLAAVSRALVLPVSLKTEQDQLRSRALSGEVEALKARLQDDPPRYARAMRAFYRRHGLTPIRNLLALVFLPLMAASVAAVNAAATAQSSPLLWVRDGAATDPTFALPLVFAGLICIYLDLVFAETRARRLLVWGLGLPLFGAVGALLSTAADVYLVASAGLLVLQRLAVAGHMGRAIRAMQHLRPAGAIVALARADHVTGGGQKVHRLATLCRHGVPVPGGVVLTASFLRRFAAATPSRRQRLLDRVWNRVGAERVVVRSSASAEDGSANSFAGIFDSVLCVDRVGLEEAIAKVYASFVSLRAQSYGVDGEAANILIQRMVDADHAGVLFTRDPAAAGLALVELVQGTADKLVSGLVAPRAFRFGRVSSELIGSERPPIDLAPLLALGRKAERIFGRPQDIEWVHAAGRFQLVQSRDITRVARDDAEAVAVDEEWARALAIAERSKPDTIVLAQNELAEVMPHPTPLSLSLMEEMWASGGSIDRACRSLGLSYAVDEGAPNYLVTLFGKLYVDKVEEHARALKLNILAKRRLLKEANDIERRFREEFLPGLLSEAALLDAVDFHRLATDDQIRMIRRVRADFVTGTHVQVDIVNVAAEFYLQHAKSRLESAGLEPTRYLAPGHDTVFSRAVLEAEQAADSQRRDILVKALGHRSLLDYELAEPRYAEAPTALDALCTLLMTNASTEERDDELASIKGLVDDVRRARRFQILKEDAKHHSLRHFAVLRRLVLALDRRLQLDGLAFYLTFDEMLTLDRVPVAELRMSAAERRARADAFVHAPHLGATLTLQDLERASGGIGAAVGAGSPNMIFGARVSGTGAVEGRACVVDLEDAESGAQIRNFADGDIVVSAMVRPDWIPYFRRAGGFVCEVGGWLSHTAILARECNVPMIVGARGIHQIDNGMRLRLHQDGRVELVDSAVSIAAE
jgi:rhodanese-related sulfurtransferase/phosphohistidine swiveling domain-containing protein